MSGLKSNTRDGEAVDFYVRAIERVVSEREKCWQELYEAHYNVVGAVIFGSRARGEENQESDLDIALLMRDDEKTDKDDFITMLRRRLSAGKSHAIEIDAFHSHKYDSFQPEVYWHDRFRKREHPYVIATPYSEVKEKVEEIVKGFEERRKKRMRKG